MYLRGDLRERWRETGQSLGLLLEWGIGYYWASVEGRPPDPLAEAVERFTADVWALARDGVITGPPEDLPFPER